MGAGASIRIEGLDQVVRDLRKTGADLEDPKDTFAKIAAAGAQIASSFAPRQSGQLAGGIRGTVVNGGAEITTGGQAVLYAGPINYGWRRHNIAPSRYMQRTDERLGPIAVRLLEDDTDQMIRRRGLS